MKTKIHLLIALALIGAAPHIHASASEDAAKKARVSVQMNEVSASEVGKFISKLADIKVVSHLPKDKDPAISLKLVDVSAHEAFSFLANLSGVKVTYKDDAVYLDVAQP